MKAEKLLLFLMILAMCIWGISWSSAKVLSAYGSPLTVTYIRFFLVPLSLFPFLKLSKIEVKLSKAGIIPVASAGLFMVAYTFLFFSGLKLGSAGAGGVLVTTTIPIFTYLLTLILVKKLPSKQAILGLILGFTAGLILLKVWGNAQSIFAAGNGVFLLAAVVYAGMSKITSTAGNYGHPIAFNFWLHLSAIALVSAFVDYEELHNILTNADAKFWWNMLYFGIVNSALATTTYFYATSKLGADKASSFMFIVPATAVFFSWLFLQESVPWNTILGGILAIVAVYIINKKVGPSAK